MRLLSSSVTFQWLVIGLMLAVPIASCTSIDKVGGNIWMPAQAIDSNKKILTREKAIEGYLQGRDLAAVEGIWVWSNNQYEVVIFRNNRNPEKQSYPEYDFVGLITDSKESNWSRGEVKLLLKETASPAVYSGTYFMRNGSEQGTAFVMSNPNLIESSIPSGPYGLQEKVLMLRMYPKLSAGSENSSKISGSGTGFFVAPEIVVTNYHVVADAKEIYLQVGQSKIKAELHIQDRQNDLALLKVKQIDDQVVNATLKSSIRCLSVPASEKSKPGQKVFVLGFPLKGTLGSKVSVSQGIINSTVGINDDPRVIQISVPIQPGNSGSPLLDEKGQVVGIVTSTLNNKFLYQSQGVIPQNVNFAVKAAYLKALLSMTPNTTCNTPHAPSGQLLDAATARELLGTAVVMIDVAR